MSTQEEWIAEQVAKAPELTPEKARRIAYLLRPQPQTSHIADTDETRNTNTEVGPR